jgi:hypothetical protein
MFNPTIETDEELEEAAKIFTKLEPVHREYALQQIKGLLEVQNKKEEDKK